MLNHTEMHSDNKMRESMKEDWEVGLEVGWRGRRRSREGGNEGGMNQKSCWGVGGGSQENQTTNQETQLCSSFGENASYK